MLQRLITKLLGQAGRAGDLRSDAEAMLAMPESTLRSVQKAAAPAKIIDLAASRGASPSRRLASDRRASA